MSPEAMADLREWMLLSNAIAELESRESECRCDANEFKCCDLCLELRTKCNEADRLMHLWGEIWATALVKHITAAEAWFEHYDDTYDGRPLKDYEIKMLQLVGREL